MGLALLAVPAAAGELPRIGIVGRALALLQQAVEAVRGNAERKAGPCGTTEHAGGIDPLGCPQASTQQVSACGTTEHAGGTDPNGCPGQ